jgi:hypothetical protein
MKLDFDITDYDARSLVSMYYRIQDQRIRLSGQQRSQEDEEPDNRILDHFMVQFEQIEKEARYYLDKYTEAHPVGEWLRTIYGIGPVISAGLLAHIDIEKALYAGQVWSFAGLNPLVKWHKGERRPWNAELKTLCWKAGQSFMKFSNQDECFYGKIYRQRKQWEVNKNDSGANGDTARDILENRKIGKATVAYKHLAVGALPPGQVDARARRFTVKLFLAHLHEVWYFIRHNERAPEPYVFSILEHDPRSYIPVPNFDFTTHAIIPRAPKKRAKRSAEQAA